MTEMIKCPNCHKDEPGKCSLGPVTHVNTEETTWSDCYTCDGNGEFPNTVEYKSEHNIWDHIDDFLEVYQKMKKGEWKWWNGPWAHKYIELRVDMRNGGCIIRNREGERILPEKLMEQYHDLTK